MAVVALILVIYVARRHRGGVYTTRNYQGGASDTIEYRGERFKMSKAYSTWDDYKDDPDNLDTNELQRIEKVMVEARVPSSFPDHREFVHALFRLKFPGYGLGGIGTQQTDDGSKLLVMSVEIPQRDKERYFTVSESDGPVVLLDDFVSSTTTNLIHHVKLQAGRLLYYDDKGFLVREKEVVKK